MSNARVTERQTCKLEVLVSCKGRGSSNLPVRTSGSQRVISRLLGATLAGFA